MLTSGAGEIAAGEYELTNQAILDAVTTEPVLICDEAGRLVCINHCACVMFGCDECGHESGGPPDCGKACPPHLQAEAADILRCARVRGVSTFVWRGRRKDGESFSRDVLLRRHTIGGKTRFVATFRASVQSDSGKEPLHDTGATCLSGLDGSTAAMALAASNADLKRAQEALAESERQLNEAQHLANVGSWTLDLQTDRLHWSDEVYRIFELNPNTFAASFEGFLNAIHPDDRDLVSQAYSASVANKEPYSIEHRLLMRDGRVKYVEERGMTHYDADGKPLRSIGTVRDISKERLAALERASLERQLQRAQRMESIGRLAGGVAHDFNNMLGVIIGHVDIAIDELPPNHPIRLNLQEIGKAAQRSKDLTKHLLAFARKQTIAPRVLDMNEAVGSMLKMLQRLIGEDIELMWLPANEVWPVVVDPSQVDQILANLCVNARDAIADVGKVTIETTNVTFDADYCASHVGFALGDYVRLTVSDNGCGMEREILDHIFEPFFTTKEAGSGTGLGLAMVYGVVKQNNGFINVYSEPGQGTTFTIYLPRYLGEEKTVPVDRAAVPPKLGNEYVLLVEDEPSLLAIFAVILAKHGYTVLPAYTPDEALQLATAHAGKIHLLLTDVVMPSMNGRELARRVGEIIPGIKRLFMSGYTANVIAHHSVLDKGVEFIQKPFSETELASKVRAVLDA